MVQRILSLAALSVCAVLVFAPTASAQELDCDDFDTQAAAQQRLKEDPSDPDGLPGEAFSGIEGVACEDLPPPTDFDPVVPPGVDPVVPPGVDLVVPSGVGEPPEGAPAKGGLPKGEPPREESPREEPPREEPPREEPPRGESPEDIKELLKAGGDLPAPQESAAPPEADGGGCFPLWRVGGMILSGGVFVFALYRLTSRT